MKNIQDYYNDKIQALQYAAERSFPRRSISTIDIHTVKSAHIIGVCGTAMASLASLLTQRGIHVTGSDQACYPPMSDLLKDLHIETLPFDIKNLIDKDIIIVGNMCGPMNIEAVYCREHDIPHFSMGEIIETFFIEDKKSIVVAGTHGKTTTTSIAISALKYSDVQPSYLVGGVMKEDGKSSYYNSSSRYFVIEGDEYDTAYFDKGPKFLHYKPYVTIITSLELDHVDIYKSYEDYKQAFMFLIEKTHDDGVIVMCIDDMGVKDLLHDIKDSCKKKIITYGKSDEADVKIHNIETIDIGQKVTLSNNDTFFISLFGEYNALNATAVYIACDNLEFDMSKVKTSFENFEGVKRRQEIWGEKNGITILDDFAHHPTAVYKTLKGIRERYADKNIIAIFEPRSNSSRAKVFEDEYAKSFTYANSVFISKPKIKKEGYNPNDFIDIDYVVDSISHSGIQTKAFEGADAIVNYIQEHNILKTGDIVVVMSNGDFDGIHKKIYDII